MISSVAKCIIHPNGLKKVEIIKRDDGTFGFLDWEWDAEEESWVLTRKYSESMCETQDIAQSEAEDRVLWLKDLLKK
jgi:hypothetical protein